MRVAQQCFGFCGLAAGGPATGEGGHPEAWLLVAPARALPAGHPLSRCSRTPDAVAVVGLHHPEPDRPDLSRHLVQALASRVVGHASCVEAMASTGGDDCRTPRRDLLEACGFTVEDSSPPLSDDTVRMRLDLQATVYDRALRVVRNVFGRSWVPVPPPEPSRREHAGV